MLASTFTNALVHFLHKGVRPGRAKGLSSSLCCYEKGEISQRTSPLSPPVSYGLDNVPPPTPQALCAFRLRGGGLWLQHGFSFFSVLQI